MPGISGRLAQASRLGLEDLLERKLLEEKLEEHRQQQAIINARADREMGQRDREFGFRESEAAANRTEREADRAIRDADRTRVLDDAAGEKRTLGNMAGVVEMMGSGLDPQTAARELTMTGLRGGVEPPQMLRQLFPVEKERKRHLVTTPGPGGTPLKRLVDEEELEQGVPEYREPKEPRAPERSQRHPVPGPDGKIIYLTEDEINARGGVPATPRQRPVSGAERQTLAFYQRAEEGDEIAKSLEGAIAKKSLPGQARLQLAPNWAQSEENQSYRQAQRAFTEARLRKESGAAIPPAEYENDAKTYFAQPGDGPGIIAQKQAARKIVLDGLANATGLAWEEFYGEPRPKGTRKSQDGDGGDSAEPPKMVPTHGGGGAAQRKPIPGIPGAEAELRDGKWVRVK